ncbi:protein REVEILLE 6-like isoform X3 [Dioscorea cayenensis subsp. rotundata]|uniref:Protein REVEILLE 6-like isoform X3 n=1 Tax=Dioscorea cayennensis subsp. rotundata TaxID=55577 RepID=A0AB40BAK2_DIOCR|nr:protein REVEILLE 6-like isoform X3 [Dioscorea cayenensis subsp. rotundata]
MYTSFKLPFCDSDAHSDKKAGLATQVIGVLDLRSSKKWGKSRTSGNILASTGHRKSQVVILRLGIRGATQLLSSPPVSLFLSLWNESYFHYLTRPPEQTASESRTTSSLTPPDHDRMVSLIPSPEPPGFFVAAEVQQQQPQAQQLGMALAAGGAVPTTVSSSEDLGKKIRKPYTITKSRESWTEQEHDKFLEALQLFDRDWKKIEAFVGSKTVIQCLQIRSHAQKYFLKVQKNGTSEHVPPPRPKRKAAHPYPQKANKNTPLLSQATTPLQGSSCLIEAGYPIRTDSSSVLKNSSPAATVPSWAHSSVQPVLAARINKDDIGTPGAGFVNNCVCSSTESSPRTWPACETTDQGNHVPSLRVMPDFAQVYSFIGSVFDPSTTGHLQKLKEMDPIDVETVLLLMRNLSINLTSPDFEDHMKSNTTAPTMLSGVMET